MFLLNALKNYMNSIMIILSKNKIFFNYQLKITDFYNVLDGNINKSYKFM